MAGCHLQERGGRRSVGVGVGGCRSRSPHLQPCPPCLTLADAPLLCRRHHDLERTPGLLWRHGALPMFKKLLLGSPAAGRTRATGPCQRTGAIQVSAAAGHALIRPLSSSSTCVLFFVILPRVVCCPDTGTYHFRRACLCAILVLPRRRSQFCFALVFAPPSSPATALGSRDGVRTEPVHRGGCDLGRWGDLGRWAAGLVVGVTQPRLPRPPLHRRTSCASRGSMMMRSSGC